MIHITFITLIVMLISPDGERMVSVREYPQPFVSMKLCMEEAEKLEKEELATWKRNFRQEGWAVIVDARCKEMK